ncbi:MAG: hypothetical protein JWR50_1034 [Mucilaginibacter sp.]|nr:hypothetical protein [Mucilaginibacter sp.]
MYRKLFLLSLLMVCCGKIAFGQEIPTEFYKASTIPDSLKDNTNSVIRYSENKILIKGPDKVIVKRHKIVTILNEKADREAIMEMGYNRKYDEYSSIEMRVYNEAGAVIKKYHKSDMYDGSAADDETIVTNERFLALRHPIASYPITIETSFEETINSFISLDKWQIQSYPEQSVQNANYSVTVNPLMGFRYKNEHTNLQPKKETNKDGQDVYTWDVKNLKAIKREDNVLLWTIIPNISFAINSFNCFGYPGDFSSWKSFGQWIEALNAPEENLPPNRVTAIQNLTKDLNTDKEKAKFLYNYMQKSMRYVGIQLGIGGYQPLSATFVDQKKYGDCKALSNYMKALLKAVNINSYYAIIRAGTNEKPADFSFPYNEFNHAILCIPFKNDTTWLECTSSTQPFGKLGAFTENRNALLITENGGKLVNTPASNIEDNRFSSEVHLTLKPDGGANADIKIIGTGVYRDDYVYAGALKFDEQKEKFMKWLNFKQPNIFNLNLSADEDSVKQVRISLDYEQFCDIMAGNKQFYSSHLIDLCNINVPVETDRKTDFYFTTPLQKSCVTTIDLPEGFTVETLPANQSLKFTYGSYQVNYAYDEMKNQVVSTAKFNITNRIIPAARYTQLQQYLDAVSKAQNKKLVIKHKA